MAWKSKLLTRFKELDPDNEILIEFNEQLRKISFANSIKQHKKQNFEDEAYVRAYLVLRLTKELNYIPEAIELEKKYSIGHPSRKEAELDLILKDSRRKKEKPSFMLIEAKTPEEFPKEKYDSIKNQLFAVAKQEIKGELKPKYLVYYTIKIEDNLVKDNAIIIDFEQYPTFDDWKDSGEPFLEEIPLEYGVAKKYTYANVDKPDKLKGLKPLRKDYILADFERLRVILHNKLWAGGEADYNDIFYHLIKIMLVKIYDEIFTPFNEHYHFQVFYKDGKPETSEELASRLDEIYKKALKELLNYDEQKISEIPLIEKDKFTYEKLFYAVERIQEISLTENIHSKDEDVLGLFFENILQNEFKQSQGQFFTHRNIVKFLIYALDIEKLAVDKLNQPRPHFPYIIDPAAGSGTFLIEIMKIITREILKVKQKLQLRSPLKSKLKDLEDPERKHKWAEDYIYGVEPNARLGLATKLNMILHGDGNMNIFIEDGLMPFKINDTAFYTRKWTGKDSGLLAENYTSHLYPRPVNEQFDCILSNPPFSMEIDAMRSFRYIEDTFVYSDKKNSENLFVERWFQLLKANGRIGVVLPESVFDTKENLYIRNYLYRYFKIKAIISLPQDTFGRYTTTKVSLLLAQKKTDDQIRSWDDKWREYANEYNKLRKRKIITFFLDDSRLSSALKRVLEKYGFEIDYSKIFVWEHINNGLTNDFESKADPKDRKKFSKLLKSIEEFKSTYNLNEMNKEENKETLKRFLKDFFPSSKEFISFQELLEYIYDDVLEIANLDFPSIKNENNYCNSWWVFGETSNHFNYPIFYADIENIGYRRTKRGEQDKDIPIKDSNGEIVAFKNDFFRIKAEKIKRQDWVKKGNREILTDHVDLIKSDILVDMKNPGTVLDYIKKAELWKDEINTSFFNGKKKISIRLGCEIFIQNLRDLVFSPYLRLDKKFVNYYGTEYITLKNKWNDNRKLRQLIKVLKNGEDVAKKFYSDSETDLFYVRINNIKPFDEIVYDDAVFLKEYEEIETKLIPLSITDGEYILTRSGTVGVVQLFDRGKLPDKFKEKHFIPSGYLITFKVQDQFNSQGLKYFLYSRISRKYFENLACGKSQQNISQEDLGRWIIPISQIKNIPVRELNSLVEEMKRLKVMRKTHKDLVDEILGERFKYFVEEFEVRERENIFLLKFSELKKSIQLRNSLKSHHPKYEYIMEILKKQKTLKLKQILSKPSILGKSPEYDDKGNAFYISPNVIKNWYINWEEARRLSEEYFRQHDAKYSLIRSDLVIARSGEGTIGKVALFEDEEENSAIISDFTMRLRPNCSMVNPKYLYFYMMSFIIQSLIEKEKKGMGNMTNIFPSQVENFDFINLAREEQNEIVLEIEAKIKEQRKIDERVRKIRDNLDEIIERKLN